MNRPATKPTGIRRRYRLLHHVDAALELPLLLLAVAWLWLFIVELRHGLSATQARIALGIWAVFVADFLLRMILAPRRWAYLRRHLITALALLVPALRILRTLRVLQLLQSARAMSLTRAFRFFSSGSRLVAALKRAQGPQPAPQMNVGTMLAVTSADTRQLEAFTSTLVTDVRETVEQATGLAWHFHCTEPARLASDASHRPGEFLDAATQRMAEGPYDLLLVVTDVPLSSRRLNLKAGLASPVCRVAIVSVRQLIIGSRQRPARHMDEPEVRWNAATLLLHLLGHMLGLTHRSNSPDNVMAPFEYDSARRTVPGFSAGQKRFLFSRARDLPERELRGGNAMETLLFHLLMAARHPRTLLAPLLHNRAPLLPLALPKLATAAVAPGLLLVFTAEIWDVALNMPDRSAITFSLLVLVGAALYLTTVQNLFLPRREKRILTEHLAVANTTIFISILLACIGLFLMLGTLMLAIALYIFPTDLMYTWSSLEKGPVVWADKLRLAAFISSIGVATGALAGGLESRTLIQHLALFRDCE